jgi:hypothetical protein
MRAAYRTALFRTALGVSVCAMVAGFIPSSEAARSTTTATSSSRTQVAFVATPESSIPSHEPQNGKVRSAGASLVLQSSMIGRQSGEPTVGVDKKGVVFFPGDTFDTPGGELARNLEMRSTDGGLHWSDVSPKTGNVGPNSHPVTLDTITWTDRDYGRTFSVDTLAAEGSLVSFTDDEGATWTSSFAPAAGVDDHETIVAGVVPDGSPLRTLDAKFPKIVYYCVNTVAAVSCSRSLDGGVTFTQMGSPFATHPLPDPGNPAGAPDRALCSSLTGHLATDRKGDVFLPSAFNEPGCGVPSVAVSTDGGTTWTDHPVSLNIKDPLNAMYVAADSAGNLYVTWQDDKYNQPYMATSRDLGAHWSTPVMVAPPGVKVSNFPSLAAGDNGRVVLTFPGSTDPQANRSGKTNHAAWNYYVIESQNALSPRPTFVSQIAPIPSALGGGSTVMHRGPCNGRCAGLFDFLDVQVAPTAGGAAYASLSDDCTGPCAKIPGAASQDPSAGQGILVRQIAGPALTGHSTRLGRQSHVLGSLPTGAPALVLLPIGVVALRRRILGSR